MDASRPRRRYGSVPTLPRRRSPAEARQRPAPPHRRGAPGPARSTSARRAPPAPAAASTDRRRPARSRRSSASGRRSSPWSWSPPSSGSASSSSPRATAPAYACTTIDTVQAPVGGRDRPGPARPWATATSAPATRSPTRSARRRPASTSTRTGFGPLQPQGLRPGRPERAQRLGPQPRARRARAALLLRPRAPATTPRIDGPEGVLDAASRPAPSARSRRASWARRRPVRQMPTKYAALVWDRVSTSTRSTPRVYDFYRRTASASADGRSSPRRSPSAQSPPEPVGRRLQPSRELTETHAPVRLRRPATATSASACW